MSQIAYVGNFVPSHSTENHVKQAWENLGHTVTTFQEGEQDRWEDLIKRVDDFDLVLWTRTADLAAIVGHKTQWRMLAIAKHHNVPTVAFHLDRWWGLNREASLWEQPFFRCQYVITADGGHQAEFASVGINHHWLSPGVSHNETGLGTPQDRFRADVAFVGSWQGGYHAEWEHRPQLVDWLKKSYPTQFWPKVGEHAIRGADLQDLYASVKVVVGDSCLVGGVTHYWSDRIPETLGRGGFLIHPWVEGLQEHYTPAEHLITWEAGDWGTLKTQIDRALEDEPWRIEIAKRGREHVIKNHTYNSRVAQILEVVK